MRIEFTDVTDHFHGIPILAMLLNCRPQAIYQWKKIPRLRCYEIAALSKGKFKAKDLMELNLKDSTPKESFMPTAKKDLLVHLAHK